MKIRVLLLVIALSTGLLATAQVTTNVLRRVLLIRVGDMLGTAFTIDIDGRQYLLTAKHVVEGLKDEDVIRVRKDRGWSTLHVKVLRCKDPVDIAVLIPPVQMTVNYPLDANVGGVMVGAEAFFVGFPYGFEAGWSRNGHYPLGLTKKATIAQFTDGPDSRVVEAILLDGYNNPGFSGSPVVIRDIDQASRPYKVVAVVSSFRFEAAPVLKTEEVTIQQVTDEDVKKSRIMEHNGHLYRVLRETGDFVKLNTGIATAYSINPAIDLIRRN